MTQPDARVEKTRETYDRRRARRAADELASVPIDRWDAATCRIVAALAVHIPGQVTREQLDDAFGPIIGTDPERLEPGQLYIPEEGTVDLREAMAADLARMGLWPTEEEYDRAAMAEADERNGLHEVTNFSDLSAGRRVYIDHEGGRVEVLVEHDKGDYRA